MIYVVIDTNVLVSALLNMNSNPGSVLLSVFKGKTIPVIGKNLITGCPFRLRFINALHIIPAKQRSEAD